MAVFIRQIYFFLWRTICHLSIFLLYQHWSCCPRQQRGVQLRHQDWICRARGSLRPPCTAYFIWKECFLSMPVRVFFPEPEGFVWEDEIPWKCRVITYMIIVSAMALQWAQGRRWATRSGVEEWCFEGCLPLGTWSGPLFSSSCLRRSVWEESSSNAAKWMMDEPYVGCRCPWMPHAPCLTAAPKLSQCQVVPLANAQGFGRWELKPRRFQGVPNSLGTGAVPYVWGQFAKSSP